MADPDRFSLPVIEFVQQIMREKFPSMNLSRGSAFYQSYILPVSLTLQPFRDRQNTIKRNQSLINYQVMTEEEMDRRASNFVVDRRQGSVAFGSQRVFYAQLQSVYIDRGAVFSDDGGHQWFPISGVVLTEIEMASNLIPETGEYYVDVAVIAEQEGEEYVAEAGQVNQFSGIPGAVRTTNPNVYSGGLNPETNTELYARITKSITNRDLVKQDAISSAIMEAFTSVRAVTVIGYGDPDMERDVVEAVVAIDQILPYSFARKVNLPLDSDGEVNWFDASGNPVVIPLGGYVGGVADMTGIDFHSVPLSASSTATTYVSVQPGFRTRLYPGYNGDPDQGDYTVTRVESVPLEPNGELVKILRLNKPFGDPQISTWDPVADLDKYAYSILGSVTTKNFHVGGKIDTYVDSTADEEGTLIINVLPENAPGISEIPITSLNPINPDTNLPLFENNQAFRLPVLGILKIEQVDFEDDALVERELIPDMNFVYVTAESRGRFTLATEDVLIIKGFEEDGTTPAFTGRRLKVYYLTNPDVPLIQSYVNDRSRRDVTKDILVHAKKIAIVDVELTYEGTLSQTDAEDIISEYIRAQGFGGTITAHEIDTLLGVFGVDKVNHPIQLRLRRDLGNGLTETESSQDELTSEEVEVFYPESPLSITQA